VNVETGNAKSTRSAPSEADEETLGFGHPPRERPTLGIGTCLSRYVVLAELGIGGMGRVVRAYDPKLQREVALKEVRSESFDGASTRRLVAEARAMAKLSHPNVVSVFDVEELESDEVVIVMEYVRGETMRDWLRAEPRPWTVVVQRFIAAGRGLAAAHGAGLLHRDFKPTNVLVDGETVKVTDFGLAKSFAALRSSSSGSLDAEGEDLTDARARVGTPRYMAPEQHRLEPLTSAADQFAFCVALWEGLCGTYPYDGRTLAQDKCEGPPPWPRKDVPRPIVDAIMRGLSPEPDDRWPSISELLERLAWDPTRQRNRWIMLAGGAGVLALGGFAYDGWVQSRATRCDGAGVRLVGVWDDARRQEVEQAVLGVGTSYATAVWTRTRRELDAYAASWADMHTEACTAATILGEQSPQMLDLRMACLEAAATDMKATVDVLADADAEVVRRAHTIVSKLPPLEHCADLEGLAAGIQPPRSEDTAAVERARVELARGRSLEEAGRYELAYAAVRSAREAVSNTAYEPILAGVALQEGSVLAQQGRYEAAEASMLEALVVGSKWRRWDVVADATTRLMYVVGVKQGRTDAAFRYEPFARGLSLGRPRKEAAWRNTLANLLVQKGDLDAAEAEHRAALELTLEAVDPDHPLVGMMRNNLANTLAEKGEYVVAESEHREVLAHMERLLGPEHPDVGMSHHNLGNTLLDQGKYAEAEHEFLAAVEIRRKALGPGHPDVADSRNALGIIYDVQGRSEEAEAEFRAILALRKAALEPLHPMISESHNNLANILRLRGKYDEAVAEHHEALRLRKAGMGPGHPLVADSHANLGLVLLDQRKFPEALEQHHIALKLLIDSMGPEHPTVANARHDLAVALMESGDAEGAEIEHRAAAALWAKAFSPEHPGVAMARHGAALALHARNEHAKALELAELAYQRRTRDDVHREARAETALLLAEILWELEPPDQDRTRAYALGVEALDLYREVGVGQLERAKSAQAWLDAHPID
jgi:tetratricopeptide (TPR) repeat protein/tRNA A-37 threonylcarbamoyl transferase component Bud32